MVSCFFRSGRGRVPVFVFCCILLLTGCGTGAESAPGLPLGNRISNCDALVEGIRDGLREHSRRITVSFDYGSDIYGELNGVVESWMEAALAETESPAEGDYLRCQMGGYTYTTSYTVSGGRWYYRLELVPEYYCYLSQEQAAAEAAEALLAEFSFGADTAPADRIKSIYDWICRTVSYDSVHRKNPYYHLKSTAYAALVQHTATCQGYCAALYRLLRASGVPCRIVTGSAEGEEGLHAWVLAEVDGFWYGLDPTWDAGQTDYSYFLAGQAEFADHIPSDRFRTEEFTQSCPMAAAGYGKEG